MTYLIKLHRAEEGNISGIAEKVLMNIYTHTHTHTHTRKDTHTLMHTDAAVSQKTNNQSQRLFCRKKDPFQVKNKF